jgi:hypothetical protein
MDLSTTVHARRDQLNKALAFELGTNDATGCFQRVVKLGAMREK